MGLFDDLVKNAAEVMGESPEHAAMTAAVVGLIGNRGAGGLQSLLQGFHDQGLGAVAASWVGTGQNLPITADQVQAALGSDTVRQLAQRAGVSPEVAASLLTAVLPTVIDRLTPGGSIPQHSLLTEGLSILQATLRQPGKNAVP